VVVVGIGMNGGLVRQVALEWDGKGQGTQWPNMDLDEVWCGSEREGPWTGVREGGSQVPPTVGVVG